MSKKQPLIERPEYRSWNAMMQRCLNPKDPSYSRYGGKGVTVCDRWRDFTVFLDEMGKRPDGTSLDRIDNNGNYEPTNCRWASLAQQARNRGMNKRNTSGYKGVSWHPKGKNWRVKIYVKPKYFSVGLFADKDYAASQYDQWAIYLHGDDANLNFEYIEMFSMDDYLSKSTKASGVPLTVSDKQALDTASAMVARLG